MDAAKQNLEWITREYLLQDAEYTIVLGDVREMAPKIQGGIDCIATEPDLGPALRELPTEQYAQEIVADLTPLFEGFLRESYQVLREGGRLAVVTPYIRVRLGKACSHADSENSGKPRIHNNQAIFGNDVC